MLRLQFIYTPTHPVSLRHTLVSLQRGNQDPTFQVSRQAGHPKYWITALVGISQSPAIICFQEIGSAQPTIPNISISVWSNATMAELEPFALQLPQWVGSADSWTAFTSSTVFSLLPPSLQRAHHRHPGLRLPSTRQILTHTISAIIEQRVTGIEAMGAARALTRAYGAPAPATAEPDQPSNMLVFPTSTAWAQIPSWEFHRAGIDAQRAATITRFARSYESIASLAASAQDLEQALFSIPGIGPWSVAETLQRTHGHPDAISVGDYHLAHTVTEAFDGVRADDSRMLEILAPFAGNRQRVITLLKASGFQHQKRAARYAPIDFRRN